MNKGPVVAKDEQGSGLKECATLCIIDQCCSLEGGGDFKLVGFNQATGAAHPAKLDSGKFGDEAARPNWWLD